MSVIIAPVTGMDSPRAMGRLHASDQGSMSVMTHEGQYAACLLMAGPPKIIRWATGQDGTETAPLPVSTWDYHDECWKWHNKNIHQITQGDFNEWWRNYKLWLMEARDGQAKATRACDCHARW